MFTALEVVEEFPSAKTLRLGVEQDDVFVHQGRIIPAKILSQSVDRRCHRVG